MHKKIRLAPAGDGKKEDIFMMNDAGATVAHSPFSRGIKRKRSAILPRVVHLKDEKSNRTAIKKKGYNGGSACAAGPERFIGSRKSFM